MPSSIDQGSALFQNIPSSWRNKEVHYSLISDEFIPAPGEKGTVRLAPETVFFQVAQKPLYIPFSPGSLHFDWDSADSYGVVRGLGGGTSDAGTPLVVKPDGVCLDKIDLAYDQQNGRRISSGDEAKLIEYLSKIKGKIRIYFVEGDTESYTFALDWLRISRVYGISDNPSLPGFIKQISNFLRFSPVRRKVYFPVILFISFCSFGAGK